MKLLLINSVCGIGSTGRICAAIAEEYEQNGYEVKIAYGRSPDVPEKYRKYAVRIGNSADMYMHVLYTRLTDRHGLASRRATRTFLKWAEEYDPDVLWLHNIHGYYINYELLFEWIKSRPKMQVKWTLHDCWAFTGHCAHYMYAGCDRWREPAVRTDREGSGVASDASGIQTSGYGSCPLTRAYPSSWFGDNSAGNFARKKKAFSKVENMTLITPSKWLSGELSKSFLSSYPVEVIYNTIDTEVFKPTDGSFREDHGISDDEKMILAVAGVWTASKGLGDILKLYELLNDPADSDSDRGGRSYRFVIVGLTSDQIRTIHASHPDIICIEHTSDAVELAMIYTAADVFINPTYEDNYPTVNLEAEACKTPVITYDTGGCSETIHLSGSHVIPQDVTVLAKTIRDSIFPDKYPADGYM